jgi:dihydroorotate dehydrogenase (NAD+) catalytic subunit
MASAPLTVNVDQLSLRTPLVAASGTVGSVWEWADVADVRPYGAAVAKSVAPEEWKGRLAPRMAPLSTGMLNGIGIQNPGIHSWVERMSPRIGGLGVPIWGSAVAGDPEGFSLVAKGLESAGVTAIEVNLSCPNLEDGAMFSMDEGRSRAVVEAVAETVEIPVGAKLSPNTPDVIAVSAACVDAGAAYLVLGNTALGFGLSLADRKPLLSGGIGGYSGPGVKPMAMRCVFEVAREMPDVAVVGCGGVSTGIDVAEYMIAGASAVEMGTIHLAEPKAGTRILKEFQRILGRLGVARASELIGTVSEW